MTPTRSRAELGVDLTPPWAAVDGARLLKQTNHRAGLQELLNSKYFQQSKKKLNKTDNIKLTASYDK